MAVRQRPAGRYGPSTKSTGRRWRYWALLGVFVVAGLVVAWVAYQNLGGGPITPQVTSYRVIDDHTVAAGVSVDRDDTHRPADCILYALSSDGDEAGRIEVFVPPSETTVQLSVQLRTDKRATTVEFYGCSYQVPQYLTKSMPPSG